MQRLKALDLSFGKPAVRKAQKAKKPPVSDVWQSMGMDQHLSEKGAALRKATGAMMDSIYDKLGPYVERAEFPDWILDKIKPLGINGLSIQGYGSPSLTTLEAGAIMYELAKRDGSISGFFAIHNAIGMAVIEALGDEEQKERLLSKGMNFQKIFSFGLTEPDFGSDASGLQTSARRVQGGWQLNGEKRWIGNATMGDCIVWARNKDDGNRIQAFIVEKGSKGASVAKMEGKMVFRMVQNGAITLKDCFVPDHNKLTHAKDFATGTNRILEASRLMIAWTGAGCMAGAYEAAVKYCVQRQQFGRPIAKFQLIQERLSRMMANTEFTISHLARLSQQFDRGQTTIGQIARAKAMTTKLGRETCALARESLGGNGILLENHVMKAMGEIEVMHTYEGTYDINMLVSGRELTGGLAAFK